MEKIVDSVNAGLDKGVRAIGAVIDDIQYGQPQEAAVGNQIVDRWVMGYTIGSSTGVYIFRLGLLVPMLETEKLIISTANQILADTRLCLLKNVKMLNDK